MRRLLEQFEELHPWSSLEIEGHVWRWLDTASAGPVVVMLPGSVGNGAMFIRTLQSLGQRLRLVAVSYPASSDPFSLARGLHGVVEHLGLSPIVLVGSSFGAWWAQHYALLQAGRVRHLLLGNTFVDAMDFAGNDLFSLRWIESQSAAELLDFWRHRVQSSPAGDLRDLSLYMLEHHQSAENLRARFVGVATAQTCPKPDLPARRVTVLDCEDDPLISAATRQRVRTVYEGSQHVSLKQGGHYPHVLNPAAYESLLLDCAFRA
jgi:maspardin